MAFAARFRGTCLACSSPIVPGQTITPVKRRHGRSGYRHEGCGWRTGGRPPRHITESLSEVVAELHGNWD